MRWGARVFGGLSLLLLGYGVWLAASQEVLSFGDDCVNGEVVYDDNQTASCECFPGWSGPQCAFCRGRIRYMAGHRYLSVVSWFPADNQCE